jgi:hypothetical protein
MNMYKFFDGKYRKWERWWRFMAGLLSWVTAALAAFSGVTALTSNEQVAMGLAIATALSAATNAALNPANLARINRTAALAYENMNGRLIDMLVFELTDEANEKVPMDEVRKVRGELTRMNAEELALGQDRAA